jgi:hypothetical protein
VHGLVLRQSGQRARSQRQRSRRRGASNRFDAMTTPTEFFRWYITDERTGKRRLTAYVMTREEAAERYPGAEP